MTVCRHTPYDTRLVDAMNIHDGHAASSAWSSRTHGAQSSHRLIVRTASHPGCKQTVTVATLSFSKATGPSVPPFRVEPGRRPVDSPHRFTGASLRSKSPSHTRGIYFLTWPWARPSTVAAASARSSSVALSGFSNSSRNDATIR